MARIDIIEPEQATGALDEIYEQVRAKRGAVANVHAIHSLHPKTMLTHIDFYVSVLYGRSRSGVATIPTASCRTPLLPA